MVFFLFRLVSARKRERDREGVWRYRGGFSYSLFFVCLFVILTISPLFISFVFSLKLAFAGFSVSSLVLSRFCILVFGISRARDSAICFSAHLCCFFYVFLFFLSQSKCYFFNAATCVCVRIFFFSCSNISWHKACGIDFVFSSSVDLDFHLSDMMLCLNKGNKSTKQAIIFKVNCFCVEFNIF